MSESQDPESRVPPPPQPLTDRAPLQPPATPDPEPGRSLTVGADGVVDEPGDDDLPGFDDDLDPSDAP